MELKRVVTAAAQGRSGMAVLVGGSSTGKTRACWESLQLLRDRKPGWRLWHPIDPSRPQAMVHELPLIGPRTVVWLNEAQFYLDSPAGGLGERIAAGLRELLRDPTRAPVLILATLWPQFWDRLTARSGAGEDPHAQARELLAGRDIGVPTAFTVGQLQRLARSADPRLTQAAGASEDGHVVQFLAGAPELLARYRNASPAAAALINAAMDARRMGMGIELPLAFLEAAAPGYLTDTDWDALGEDWLEQALVYTTVRCKGVRGPLSRIRPRIAGQAAAPSYRLADYLDQHGRRTRSSFIPPASFWSAAGSFASSGDMGTLGEAASRRGMLHDAARLLKKATALGNADAASLLVWLMRPLHPADHNPARWAAAHAAVDDLAATTWLLKTLQQTGAADQVKALADRAVVHARLDDPAAVAELLGALWAAGATDQVKALADRAVVHARLDDPAAVAELLGALWAAGATDQVKALADRAAVHARLDDPAAVAELLGALWAAGATDQVKALADRAVVHARLDDPAAVAELLGALWAAGATDQVKALADRAAAHTSLDRLATVTWLDAIWGRDIDDDDDGTAPIARDRAGHTADDNPPYGVIRLLSTLRRVGADDQAEVLAVRIAAHAPLDYPGAICWLLDSIRDAAEVDDVAVLLARDPAAHAAVDSPVNLMRLLGALQMAGASEQVKALADRAAVQAPLDKPDAAAKMLDVLWRTEASEQVKILANRIVADPPLDNPVAVAVLLDALWKAEAGNQVKTLADRAAVHAALDASFGIGLLLETLEQVGASEQAAVLLARKPAAHVRIDYPASVASLLDVLGKTGATDQVKALADRAAIHSPLDDPLGIARLLDTLRKVGASEQTAVLLARDPAAHVRLDGHYDRYYIAWLLDTLREGGATDQVEALACRVALHARLDYWDASWLLVNALWEAGATSQIKALAERVAIYAPIDNPVETAILLDKLREAGATDQVKALADRAVVQAPFGDLIDLPRLLHALQEAGATDQVKALADRAAAYGPLDRGSAAILLDLLQKAGAKTQLTALVHRMPAEGQFDVFRNWANHQTLYRFGVEPNGAPASPWHWDDLD